MHCAIGDALVGKEDVAHKVSMEKTGEKGSSSEE
jgi:hypothetical protein